ncbi:MAG: LPS assembly lipoprotein LptE [Sideroxydans sp.]|nr:LPS assembly lipoprotein LptE [Sideroxydans sp.]
MKLRALILAVLMVALTGCGFHLRGQAGMPFKSIYLDVPNLNTPFINELRRNLIANKLQLASDAAQADVILNIVSELNDKQILTLGGTGRVSEFKLRTVVSLRAFDNQQRDWIRAEELSIEGDYSYDDTKILAKEAEEALLYNSMRTDMVQQIVRRLSHAKLQTE